MKRGMKKLYSILIRYFILIVLGLGNLALFYWVFTPLTIYPVYSLLSFFYEVYLSGIYLFVDGFVIELIGACVAGSAYYLLLILNLTTPMPLKTRIWGIFYSFLTLLIVNILRIFLLSVMFVERTAFFGITHKVFWYALSIVFVIAIWVSEVKIFKIKNIPVYNDFKNIKKLMNK